MEDTVFYLFDVIRHMDLHLAELSASWGVWVYAILFLVIFAETGLVVLPFLPGDSLLFAIGALVAIPESELSLPAMLTLLIAAAVIGDAVNYAAGRSMGPRVFRSESSRILNREHLFRAQRFYYKYGGRAIFWARFTPIIRTFVPFVAGVGQMNYSKFWLYNVSGAICWVGSFLVAGFLFGNVPIVKQYFHLVIVGIIIVSLLPIAFEWYAARRATKNV
jgi:membrane-associated protein